MTTRLWVEASEKIRGILIHLLEIIPERRLTQLVSASVELAEAHAESIKKRITSKTGGEVCVRVCEKCREEYPDWASTSEKACWSCRKTERPKEPWECFRRGTGTGSSSTGPGQT